MLIQICRHPEAEEDEDEEMDGDKLVPQLPSVAKHASKEDVVMNGQ
jgi:hypothetical protein